MGQRGVSFDGLRHIALETQRGAPVEESLALNTHQWAGRTYDDIRNCLVDYSGGVLQTLSKVCGTRTPGNVMPLDYAVDYVRDSFGSMAVGFDVGCGRGQFVSEAPTRTGFEWMGSDKILYLHWKLGSEEPEDELAQRLRQAYQHAPADRFFLQDIQNMQAVPDEAVHLITSHCAVTYTLETRTLEEIERVLAPGGLAIVGVPNLRTQRNPYADRGTTRENAFAELRTQGYAIDVVPGDKNDFCILHKKESLPPMRFAADLTNEEMLHRYSGEFRP